MSEERTLFLQQNPSFEHVQQELFTMEPEWTVLQPIYGPNPYWRHADQKAPIGTTCRRLYAISTRNSRYVLAVVRTSGSDRPLPIFETSGPLIQAIISANPNLKGKVQSFVRYSDFEDAKTELFDYDQLKERESLSFPTTFILTTRELPRDFRVPFVDCKHLVKSTYSLNKVSFQMIHVSSALLHAIISLAEAFNLSHAENPIDPHPEDIRRFALVIAKDLTQFLDSLMHIVKRIKGEDFDQASAQTTIDQIFIDLCSDYPGAVNIRRSGERFEELKELDRKEAQLSGLNGAARNIEEKVVVSSSEQDALVQRADADPVQTVQNSKESLGVIPSKSEPLMGNNPVDTVRTVEESHAITLVKGFDLGKEETDTAPVEAVYTAQKSSSTGPNEPDPRMKDTPVETARIVEKGHATTPVQGYDLGEGETDSVPAEKVTSKAPQYLSKGTGTIKSLRHLLMAQKVQATQNILPILSNATSWVAPLEDFPGVIMANVDEGAGINPVGTAFKEPDFHGNTDTHFMATSSSSQTIAYETQI
ncbi:hypothetical protein M408DRAFT_12998 [Serendipita vermifera MAFF 305830]|uniref:Uncharacterized protein n=1 Tax=Serendipita vermifera MAFF 305830 TaxID=933852 RepID=A0A0C2WSC6_SERVB|nr:hypothetical protein M408DRAFT_12998 [Serendipita vermifera MAFF 305830]